jgi:hypothetical protein
MRNGKARMAWEELITYFSYDENTGTFSVKKQLNRHYRPDQEFGKANGTIRFNNVKYDLDKLAIYYVTKVYPKKVLHINGNLHDNRFNNLTVVNKHSKRIIKPEYADEPKEVLTWLKGKGVDIYV